VKIFLNQIPQKGLFLSRHIRAEELDLPKDVFDCQGPLLIEAALENAGDEILARVTVSGCYRLRCVRCLDVFETDTVDRFDLAFDIDSETGFIDLTESLRDELIIAAPLNPCCRTDCRGLCLGCGINLNTEQCQCQNADGATLNI